LSLTFYESFGAIPAVQNKFYRAIAMTANGAGCVKTIFSPLFEQK
jgi:hypothetical protein